MYGVTSQEIIAALVKKKVKLSLLQAVEARRAVRRRGFHIFRESAHR
jgi:hypothetical protein